MKQTLFLVRVTAWIEADQWVAAESAEDAKYFAEQDYAEKRRNRFKIADEGISCSDICAQHDFAGSA